MNRSRRHKPRYCPERGRTKFRQHAVYFSRFVDTDCYFTNQFTGDAKRQIQWDLEMYWYGLQCKNVAILGHARRHFVQHAHKSWPLVSAQVIQTLFLDPRFVLLGELKEYAVRVARDHICLRGRGRHHRLKRLCFDTFGMWKQREFRSMLKEELEQSWVTGSFGRHRPSNMWYHYEERFRLDLADIDNCNDIV